MPEYFKFQTGTFMTHIPYKGEAAAISDLIAGQVDLMFTTLINAGIYVKSGRLRMLAVTMGQRLAELSRCSDHGRRAQAEGLRCGGVAGPCMHRREHLREIVNRLAAEVDAILKSPAMIKRLAELGALPGYGSPEQLARFQRSEQERWRKVIQAAKIKPE